MTEIVNLHSLKAVGSFLNLLQLDTLLLLSLATSPFLNDLQLFRV